MSGDKFAILRHVRERRRMRVRRAACVGPVIPPLGRGPTALGRLFSRVPRVVRASVSLLAFSPLDHFTFYLLPIRLSERYVTKCKFDLKKKKTKEKKLMKRAACTEQHWKLSIFWKKKKNINARMQSRSLERTIWYRHCSFRVYVLRNRSRSIDSVFCV